MALSTRLRAILKHEISAADVEALLRGSGQLEELREKIDRRRQEGEVTHPGRPWETHAEMESALAFFWVAQSFIAIARALKDVDDESDPHTQGYLPEVSHRQAMALLRQVPDYLGLTSAALADPAYDHGRVLPVTLQPRVEAAGRCPASHYKGILRGARYLAEYAQVEVETYCNAVAKVDPPSAVQATVKRLQAELARAQSTLQTAEQTIAPILTGEPVDEETHEEVETYLWSSLETFVWLGQVVAMPSLLQQSQVKGHRRPPPPRTSRKIARGEKWCLTSRQARHEMRTSGRTAWAQAELDELWTNKHWTLSAQEREYLDEITFLRNEGAIETYFYLAECPFNPIWTAQRDITIMGRRIPAGSQFAYNHHAGRGELQTDFHPVDDFPDRKGR